jgi:cytochrome oxidase Cu insertion factor (SCO1/SenC/PrrC family)
VSSSGPFVTLTLVLVAALSSYAQTIPARQATPVPDVQILDEASQSTSLRSMLNQMGSGPVILLPIFTRCSASCPVLTRKLEAALVSINTDKPYRVLVFSFDPLETAESLRLYQTHERIPAHWKIVRSDESGIRQLFGFLHYSVMDQGGKLVHPNEVFLLDQSLNWRWTLVGEDWSSQELATDIDQTRSPGFVAWLKANPESLAWIGFAATILSISLAISWIICRKRLSPACGVGAPKNQIRSIPNQIESSSYDR